MDQTRCLKLTLEQNLGVRISCQHPVVKWLVEHACYTLNHLHLDTEGKTAYGKLHGVETAERL